MAVTTVVGLLTLLPLLLLGLARLSLLFLGRYLISQTQDRRDILQALFNRVLDSRLTENVGEVDNGWEKVGTQSDKLDQEDWSGIIAFFHPFWYDSPTIHEQIVLTTLAMPEGVVNEFCGLPSKPPNENTPEPSAQSTLVTMT